MAESKKHKRSEKGFSIVYKLFFILFFILLFPLVLFLLFNYYNNLSHTKQQAAYSYQKIFDQTTAYLNTKVVNIKAILDMVVSDTTLQDLAADSEQYFSKDLGTWVVHANSVKYVLLNIYNNRDISEVVFYSDEGANSFLGSRRFEEMTPRQQQDWLENTSESPREYMWYAADGNALEPDTISLIYNIPDLNKTHRTVGLVVADIPAGVFSDILAQAAITKSTSVLLFNSHQDIFAAAGPEEWREPEQLSTLQQALQQGEANQLHEVSLAGERYFLYSANIEKTDWRACFLVPMADVIELTTASHRATLTILAVLLLVAIPVVYIIATATTRKFVRLNRIMKTAADGNFNVEILFGGNDEIGQLTRTFNYMLTKITLLIDERQHMADELKNSELLLLQAQINPHFLYNTLEMIHWMAIRAGAPDVNEAVESLARFYKLSLGRGERFVTVREEIAHIVEYVRIQNMRFGNAIKLEVDVPEELMGCRSLKVILQPLVENSILHGILEKDSEEGVISITVFRDGGDILFSVKDDGVGMDAGEIDGLFKPSAKGGYGVINIDYRLRLTYGDTHGLHYTSKRGEGTTVTYRIPFGK